MKCFCSTNKYEGYWNSEDSYLVFVCRYESPFISLCVLIRTICVTHSNFQFPDKGCHLTMIGTNKIDIQTQNPDVKGYRKFNKHNSSLYT